MVEGDDLCDSLEQHQGVDGNGLLVESGCAWRKVNLQRILEESTKNLVKMRSHEAGHNLKPHKSPEENHNQTPAVEEFHDQTFAAQGLHDQTFAPQGGFDYSEGRSGSSSASGSDSESNSSDSGSDSGSYSSSRSRSSDGSSSESSSDSESDTSSSSEGLESTDEDVDILSDEKEPKHQAEVCDQRTSLPIPVKSLDGKSTQNAVDEKQDDNKSDAVDIEKDSSKEWEAKMAPTTNTISDRVRKYAEETKAFSYDYQQPQERKDYTRSSFYERGSEVKDSSRNEQSDSFEKLSTGKHQRDSELKNIGEKSEGTKRLKGGNLDS
ncbi:hypothetical protein MtrunA17_Chr1g0154531 [Medicago truncatula]|uniref:Dentin sialophosphoprotein-like n=1 Tax=Medicago truncatula TaxID=3880 RepID=A0A072VEP7_MEDTR|nr:clumping factor B [Medicago truncatula]XP_024626774.1 clumping factor B [Medicago truncatula]XP_024626888.1 clumping factor B [Medicago truncatula]XP_039688897.1 clumping factor B [Medicago truncatula]XP_039688899.1 clumping factor B [Medicago truncatula]XP_039688900.1 clumping factor B [Medicago truncatula]XP_039688903.1 clumping factor B [Medicago truncatula]XP_039688905.1 clumping factor B [Medicago truncatula]XP_039688908.1 clumping factor B [Medicago truncatula]XP_039688911.1 clump